MKGLLTILIGSTGYLDYAVRVDPAKVSVEAKDDKSLVRYEGAFPGRDLGEPELPVLERFLLLPSGARVDSIVVDQVRCFKLAERVNIPTLQWPRIPDLPRPDSVPPKITTGRFPKSPAELGYVGDMRGERIAILRILPLTYDLDSRELWFNESFRVRIFYTEGSAGPKRATGPWAAFINNLVENPGVTPGPAWGTDYIIITSEALAPSFQRLVDWRRAKGMRAELFTTEWITAVYPGVDPQERIRNFIKHAYEVWNVSFVLIGGNQHVVPMRLAYQPMGYPEYGDSVPTDLYYACLDGDWNPDGDNYWGEWPDTIDLLPDVFVSRVPVSQPSEAEAYISKLIRYETEAPEFPTRGTINACDLFSSGDGIYYGRRIAKRFPSFFRIDSLYEANIGHDITVQELTDTLNQGPSYLFMIGHGNWWRILIDKSAGITFDLENAYRLRNPAGFFSYLVSCHGNSLYESSVGKAMLLSPTGGSVVSLGSGKLDFADYGTLMAESVFVNILSRGLFYAGQADLTAKSGWAGMATTSPMARHLLFAYNLMGDPATELWTGEPKAFECSYDTVVGRRFEVRVTWQGKPVPGATVTLTGPGTHEIEQTDARGGAVFEGLAIPDDTVQMTVTSHDFRPYLARVPVLHAGSILSVSLSTWPEGTIPMAGDTFRVRLSLRNTGTRPTGPLNCTVRSDTLSTLLPLVERTAAPMGPGGLTFRLTNISAGEEKVLWFDAIASENTPPTAYLSFWVISEWPDASRIDSFRLMAYGPSVELAGVKWNDEGSTRHVYPDVMNSGQAPARKVACYAILGSDTLAKIKLGRIGPGEHTGYNKHLTIPQSISSLTLLLEIGGGSHKAYSVVLRDPPPSPVSVKAFPEQGGVRLTWAKQSGAKFYRVYRAGSREGPYELVSSAVSEASFLDMLGDDRVYYWKISSCDQYLNEGEPSEPVSERRNPNPGPFNPVYLPGIGYPWAQAFELDPARPGREIVVAGLKDYIHLLGADGEELPGWPKQFPGASIYATPVIGDVTGDGVPEIIASVSFPEGSYIYAFGADGSVAESWPRFVEGGRVIFLMMGELNGDGNPELIAKDERGFLHQFRSDPSEDSHHNPGASGTLFPAIADLDGDGKAEILDCHYDPQTYKGLLHAFKPDWTEIKGFPAWIDSIAPVSGGISIAELNPSYPGPEIVLVAGNSGVGTYIGVLTSAGCLIRPPSRLSPIQANTPPTISDVNGDGKPDVIVMIKESLIVCSEDGVPRVRKEVRKHAEWWPGSCHPVTLDLDGDGDEEIFFGSFNGFLHGVDGEGRPVPGFPINLSMGAGWAGNIIFSAPSLSDLEGDGSLNMILPSCARYLYSWETGGSSSWPSPRHDPWNTGFREFVLPDAKALASGQNDDRPNLALYSPYPNPFRNETLISYSLPDESHVSLRLYDVSGRRVKEIVSGKEEPGFHALVVDTRDLASGVYFLRLDHPKGRFTKKITKIR
ncbi:MAG: C25 family cysteine peptidase [candidate division WOR-3 bacterium]